MGSYSLAECCISSTDRLNIRSLCSQSALLWSMAALQLTQHLYAVPVTQVAIELLCFKVLTQCDIVFVRSLLCRRDGSATFDFTGTGPEVHGNLNAPPAVAYSAIIYSLRCLVTRDIPLNQGCLAPIKVGCLLCWAMVCWTQKFGQKWERDGACCYCKNFLCTS